MKVDVKFLKELKSNLSDAPKSVKLGFNKVVKYFDDQKTDAYERRIDFKYKDSLSVLDQIEQSSWVLGYLDNKPFIAEAGTQSMDDFMFFLKSLNSKYTLDDANVFLEAHRELSNFDLEV